MMLEDREYIEKLQMSKQDQDVTKQVMEHSNMKMEDELSTKSRKKEKMGGTTKKSRNYRLSYVNKSSPALVPRSVNVLKLAKTKKNRKHYTVGHLYQ